MINLQFILENRRSQEYILVLFAVQDVHITDFRNRTSRISNDTGGFSELNLFDVGYLFTN